MLLGSLSCASTANITTTGPLKNTTDPAVIAQGRIMNVSHVLSKLVIKNATTTKIGAGAIPLTTSIATSDNYAGYFVYNSTSLIKDVVGTWIVQTANPTTPPSYSAQWIGDGGAALPGKGDNTLLQTGTESDYYSGSAHYYAWYEYDPKNATLGNTKYCGGVLCTFTITPGDQIIAQIYLMPGTTNNWNVSIIDYSTGIGYYKVLALANYQAPSRKYAEWIDERPLINGVRLNLSAFGTADFGHQYAAGYNYAGINSSHSNYIGNWQNIIEMSMYSDVGDKLLAYPSALASDQQSFTVTRTSNMTR